MTRPKCDARSTPTSPCTTPRPWSSHDEQLLEDRSVLAGTPAQVVEQLGALEAAGVDEVIIADWNLDDAKERTETLERFASEVLRARADIG